MVHTVCEATLKWNHVRMKTFYLLIHKLLVVYVAQLPCSLWFSDISGLPTRLPYPFPDTTPFLWGFACPVSLV